MIEAWLVVRKEKHVDDKYWVCFEREDALAIAKDVAAYWKKNYKLEDGDVNTKLFSNLVFQEAGYEGELYTVTVEPILLRQKGETWKQIREL